ncbi:hypothetical protein [Neobacillus cucumis]|nr:hypothetical protein [Neobacillus cucumis]
MESKKNEQMNHVNNNEEVQQTNRKQVKEITDAQRDGIRYDYTDSSDFK